ncbi:AAA family ATPase [Rhizosaccharibacter radicis]|uniref:AAA family ATPase n=1 Tax=Rhizosaccharibacter radicis TaxID=2782605 RepID=UPI003BF53EED
MSAPMILRSLELHQFRRFDRPVRLQGLGPGINLLCGPNEFGKSTLLAALRAALFDPHRSKADAIERHRPLRGGAAPLVAAEFELGADRWRVEKRFLGRPFARLQGAGATWDNDEAEEKLAALLRLPPPPKGRDGRDAGSIWRALLVTQGASLQQAELGEGARNSLAACLDAELGELTGQNEVMRLLRPVQADLAALLDGRNNPRGRYKAALEALDDARRAADALQQRRARLADDLAVLVEHRLTLARETDPAGAAEDDTALAAARTARERIQTHQTRIQALTNALALSERAVADARAEQERRRARREALAAAERALDAALGREAAAGARSEAARQALIRDRQAFDRAQEAVEAAGRAAGEAARSLADAERRATARDLAERLRIAEAAAAEVTRLDAALMPLARATPDRLRALDDADAALRRALLAADSAGTLLQLALEPGVDATLDGRPVPAGAELRIAEAAVLHIAGVGKVRIVPPAAPGAGKRHAAVADAREALRGLLDELGAADPAAAHEAVAQAERMRRALDEARRQLSALVPGDAARGLRPGLEALRVHAASVAASVGDAAPAATSGGAPDRSSDLSPGPADPAALRAALARAERALEEARLRAAEARRALLAPDAEQVLAAELLRDAREERVRAEAGRDRLRDEDASASTLENDETLAGRRLDAEARWRADRARLEALEADAPTGTLAMCDAQIQRLEARLASRRDNAGRLREDIVRLETRIAQEEGVGLDEALDAQERLGDALGAEVAAFKREADVLLLLRDTLERAGRDARERHLAPLTGRMTPFLRALLPGAAVELDDGFRVRALHRRASSGGSMGSGLGTTPGPGDAEPFERLSDGTQEQIAVLARLAFADMLVQGGQPAVLVLDDVLAFSDRARAERMFDILSEAATRMQIVVLTCRADLFAGLGGRPLRLEESGDRPD